MYDIHYMWHMTYIICDTYTNKCMTYIICDTLTNVWHTHSYVRWHRWHMSSDIWVCMTYWSDICHTYVCFYLGIMLLLDMHVIGIHKCVWYQHVCIHVMTNHIYVYVPYIYKSHVCIRTIYIKVKYMYMYHICILLKTLTSICLPENTVVMTYVCD